MTIRSRLAWWSLWLLRHRPVKGVDYTRRCPGCGYYDGESEAGADHYGWSCHPVAVPWWEPIADWWWYSGLVGWAWHRWQAWRNRDQEAQRS